MPRQRPPRRHKRRRPARKGGRNAASKDGPGFQDYDEAHSPAGHLRPLRSFSESETEVSDVDYDSPSLLPAIATSVEDRVAPRAGPPAPKLEYESLCAQDGAHSTSECSRDGAYSTSEAEDEPHLLRLGCGGYSTSEEEDHPLPLSTTDLLPAYKATHGAGPPRRASRGPLLVQSRAKSGPKMKETGCLSTLEETGCHSTLVEEHTASTRVEGANT